MTHLISTIAQDAAKQDVKDNGKRERNALFMGPNAVTIDTRITTYVAAKGDLAHKFERFDGVAKRNVTWYPERGFGFVNGAKSCLPFGADVDRSDDGLVTAAKLERTIGEALFVKPEPEEIPNPYELGTESLVTIEGTCPEGDPLFKEGVEDQTILKSCRIDEVEATILDWLTKGRTITTITRYKPLV